MSIHLISFEPSIRITMAHTMFLISIIPKYMANPLYAVPLYGLWLCRNVSIGRGKSSIINVFAYYFIVMCEIYSWPYLWTIFGLWQRFSSWREAHGLILRCDSWCVVGVVKHVTVPLCSCKACVIDVACKVQR